MQPVLLYLHGFNSSPLSHKARMLQRYMRARGLQDSLRVPQIPPQPAAAFAMLCELYDYIAIDRTVAVAGSSLGGFYATALAERSGCRAVLINPAVRPQHLLRRYLGANTNYHTAETWQMEASHLQQLRELDVEMVSRHERYLLLLQTSDETLDYRDAIERYSGCETIVEQGGSHAFDGFERHIEKLLAFCEFDLRNAGRDAVQTDDAG